MNCKNCGAILSSNDLFCKQCGQAINTNSNIINNTQNQTTQRPYTNSYSNYNEQYYQSNQQYNNYNNYNNTANHTNFTKIILIIILTIVFFIVGWFLGKMIFGKQVNTNNLSNTQSSSDINNSNLSSNTTNPSNYKNLSNPTTNNSITPSTNSSYIVTNSGLKVHFNIANTLKEDINSSDEEYRCFEKSNIDDNLTIWIREEDITMDEYMSDLDNSANRQKQNNEYNNVQLSEIKTKTVNNKNFLFRTFTYNMGYTEFKDVYIAYEISKNSLYTIEIEDYQSLTNEELNGLLSITIEN